MAGVNKVILVGHLGRDPELTYSQSGKAVARLNLATTERWGGEDHTEWHRVVCFDRLAEICGEYLSKGRMIYIEGRLQTRSWDDPNGVKKYFTDVLASHMQMLGGASSGGAGGGGSRPPQPPRPTQAPARPPQENRPPSERKAAQEPPDDPFTGDYGPPPTDDDIPF